MGLEKTQDAHQVDKFVNTILDSHKSLEDRVAALEADEGAPPLTITNELLLIPIAPSVPHGISTYYGARMFANGDYARFTFTVPTDFSALVGLDLIYMTAGVVGTNNVTFSTEIGAIGESYNNHTDSVAVNITASVAGQLYATDVSAAVTNIAAGDVVGALVVRNSGGAGVEHLIIGVRLRYTS